MSTRTAAKPSKREARRRAREYVSQLVELAIDDGKEDWMTAELWKIYDQLTRHIKKP